MRLSLTSHFHSAPDAPFLVSERILIEGLSLAQFAMIPPIYLVYPIYPIYPIYFGAVRHDDRDSHLASSSEQRHHSFLVTGLAPGRSYLVSVAASTSAGQGNATTAQLETQVPKPQPPAPPRVRPDLVTESTVTLTLPSAASPDGPPVSRYYVIVSDDPDFNGREVEGYSSADLPNAEEASSRGISFYVAAVADAVSVVRRDAGMYRSRG